jgi:YggT family protein
VDALIFVVDSVFTFAVYAFLLRVLLPLARADFRNPLAQAVLALTNWLVMPLRRLLPPVRRLDTASVVALLAVQFVATLVVFRLQTGALIPFLPLALASLRALALAVIFLYTVLIFLYALLSFIAPGVHSPATVLLASLCEPVLRPIRRALPIIGGLDFSPLVAIVGLQALRLLLT